MLREASRRARAGVPPAAALGALEAVEGGGLVVGAVALAADLGGDVVRALAALGDGLAERERLRTEVAVATAQAAFTARIVPPSRSPRGGALADGARCRDVARREPGRTAPDRGERRHDRARARLLRRIARGALP